MKPFRTTLVITIMAAGAITAPLMGQASDPPAKFNVPLDGVKKALEQMPKWKGQLDQADMLLKQFRLDDPQVKFSLDEAGAELFRAEGLLDQLKFDHSLDDAIGWD